MTTKKPEWRDEVAGLTTQADTGPKSYPCLQYLNGRREMLGSWRENGCFFLSAEQNVDCKWEKAELITSDGNVIDGYKSEDIRCSVIRLRRAWFVKSDGANRRFPWSDYDAAKRLGKARGKVQIVMSVDGIAEMVALTLSGLQSSFATSPDGWGGNARKRLYDPTARILHIGYRGPVERLPALQFSIVIGPETVNGKPVYSKVGKGDDSNYVTRIILKGPLEAVSSDSDISRYIVPRVIRESYEIEHSDSEEWATSWDKASEESEDINNGADFS